MDVYEPTSGSNGHGQSDPPSGTFHDLVAGFDQACATRDDGEILCWGDNDDGQLDFP